MDLRRGGAGPHPYAGPGERGWGQPHPYGEDRGVFPLFPARMQSLPILLQKPPGLDELAIRVREILT